MKERKLVAFDVRLSSYKVPIDQKWKLELK